MDDNNEPVEAKKIVTNNRFSVWIAGLSIGLVGTGAIIERFAWSFTGEYIGIGLMASGGILIFIVEKYGKHKNASTTETRPHT